MSTQAKADIDALLNELMIATNSLDSKGREFAIKESEYRVVLRKALIVGRAEGYPVTILRDICLGLDEVANARLMRDIAQAQYDAMKERINTLKLHIRMLDEQIRRDFDLAGRVT
jgi:hypothetical protein